MPFTREQFFQAFADYNQAVWPAQLLLFALGVLLTAIAYFAPARGARWIGLGLALLWAWMGAAYHLAVFREINPAATFFGAAFLAQAGLFAFWAFHSAPAAPVRAASPQHWIGGAMLGYALVGYPILGWLQGHRYPANPTFGLPCPTTIATLGLLLWVRPAPPWWLLVMPLAWVLVGTSAAINLGVSEDFGLLAAGVAYSVTHLGRRRRTQYA